MSYFDYNCFLIPADWTECLICDLPCGGPKQIEVHCNEDHPLRCLWHYHDEIKTDDELTKHNERWHRDGTRESRPLDCWLKHCDDQFRTRAEWLKHMTGMHGYKRRKGNFMEPPPGLDCETAEIGMLYFTDAVITFDDGTVVRADSINNEEKRRYEQEQQNKTPVSSDACSDGLYEGEVSAVIALVNLVYSEKPPKKRRLYSD